MIWTILTLAAILGCALTLLTEYAWRHRAQLAAEYRALTWLHGTPQHARPVSRPHLTLVGHGHRGKPREKKAHTPGRHQDREAVAA